MQVDIEINPDKRAALKNGFAASYVVIPSLGIRAQLFLPYDDFHRYCGAWETIADDFLFVSTICFSIDLLLPRSSSEDKWTREISVKIPVRNNELWESQAALFTELLTFLTGDKWNVAFSTRDFPLYVKRMRRRRSPRWAADTVCLFSGGLDSLIGAIDSLSTTPGHIALVGHYDLGLAKSTQSRLFNILNAAFGERKTHLFQGRIGINSGATSDEAYDKLESTQRSRSLVFAALGVYIAHQQHKDKQVNLLIPENGFISLNPPLTPSRLGSCSTRTVHPYFLAKLQRLIDNLGMLTPISNPLADKTKGQALVSSSRQDLIQALAHQTVSCAHPTRRQNWNRRSVHHCGYCVPCLIRRAALHRVGLDEGAQYGIDVLSGELHIREDVADDLRAILAFVYNGNTNVNAVEQIIRRIPFSDSYREQAVQVLTEQIKELGFWIQAKGVQEIRQWAGL